MRNKGIRERLGPDSEIYQLPSPLTVLHIPPELNAGQALGERSFKTVDDSISLAIPESNYPPEFRHTALPTTERLRICILSRPGAPVSLWCDKIERVLWLYSPHAEDFQQLLLQ